MSHQPLISVEEALDRILSSLKPVSGYESLSLRQAVGRITAGDLFAPHDVPPHRNSAMDGYAVIAQDLPVSGNCQLECVGRSFAGEPWSGELQSGQCIRIMTGAVVPAGADTVIMQEKVERQGDRISVPGGQRLGDNVRMPGEDFRVGDLVLSKGQRLGTPEIGLAASLGIADIRVKRRLRVAICSTGDELKAPGEPLGEGDIYDSNRPLLTAALSLPSIDLLDLGIIPDHKDRVRELFHEASTFADLLITSGGVSVGEADFVKEILSEMGQIDFWRIAIKPGKPLAFGSIGNTCFFGLPGNPVSALVTLREFVYPALNLLAGGQPRIPLRCAATLSNEIRKKPGRREYQRGILSADRQGNLKVATAGHQGSHVLSSFSKANCFIILPEQSNGARPGEQVIVEPLGERL